MKIKSVLLVVGLMLSVSSVYAKPDAAMQADDSAISSACQAEAATAGCGAEVVGKGLLKCIHTYKMANKKTFQISPGCKAAMSQRKSDKAAGK